MTQQLAPISGIILATGSFSHMGSNDLMLPFRGKPILQHVIDATRQCDLKEILIVFPESSQMKEALDTTGCKVITNSQSHMGQSASLSLAIKNTSPSSVGAMVLVGNQPLVTSASLGHLHWIFSIETSRSVAPVHEGLLGDPVIIPRACFNKALELTGDTGTRELIAMVQARVHLVEIRELGPFVRVDTTKEYDRLLRLYENCNAPKPTS